MTDSEAENRVARLRDVVQAWAARHNLWHDAHLKSYAEHFNDRPWRTPCVLVLTFDGWKLFNVFNESQSDYDVRLLAEFSHIVEQEGFEWEQQNSGTVVIVSNPDEEDAWYQYFHFRWLCELVRPGYVDVSAEILAHFQHHQEDLHKLTPRSFEVLIDAVFRNNGFRTELGPGQGDGGVDVRLFRSDLVGEMLTLVQVKRYSPDNAVGLDAVAALKAIVDDQQANSGLFVTTSRFLPGVQDFAARQGRVLQLADKSDVVRWCATAADTITRETDRAWVEHVLKTTQKGAASEGLVGQVVHATWGYGVEINDFRIIVRSTRHAVLLAPLKTQMLEHDGYGQTGYEVPHFELQNLGMNALCIAKLVEGRTLGPRFWGDHRLFVLWDGAPKYFSWLD